MNARGGFAIFNIGLGALAPEKKITNAIGSFAIFNIGLGALTPKNSYT